VNVNFPLRTALPDLVPMTLALLEVGKKDSSPFDSRSTTYIHQALTERLLCTW
jgi:hypothetical protein